jgi:hypothetical protein
MMPAAPKEWLPLRAAAAVPNPGATAGLTAGCASGTTVVRSPMAPFKFAHFTLH